MDCRNGRSLGTCREAKHKGALPAVQTIPDNFLGLGPQHSDYAKARYAILPVPYDSTTSFQVGTRNGPRAIITASQQVELFDEELSGEFHATGIATLPPICPEMAGPQRQVEAVYQAARKIVRDAKFLMGLGGEHSISSGLVRAVSSKHKRLSVLQIDAHADLRDEWEGTPWSHACVMRRIVDMKIPIVQVGIRNYSRGEHVFMRKAGLRPISAAEIHGSGGEIPGVRHSNIPRNVGISADLDPADWIERAVDGLTDDVFVTIDIDGFDPAYAPGTGTPEPGGLNWYQVTGLLRAVAQRRRIVAADVVEVMPIPGSMQTEFLAAKVVYKIIAYTQQS